MMQAKIKRAWLDALRSGNYSQAREVLRVARDSHPIDGNAGYCCLGVLLDVSINEDFLPELELTWSRDVDQVEYYDANLDESGAEDEYGDILDGFAQTDGQLGAFLCDAFGISDTIESNLVNKNDSGVDFLAIADYIEEVL